MNKSKSSALFVVVPLISVIHLVNGAQFLNAAWITWCSIIAISHLT